MTRTTKAAGAAVLAALAGWGTFRMVRWRQAMPVSATPVAGSRPSESATPPKEYQPARASPDAQPLAPFALSDAKKARLAQIRRDYDEIRARMTQEYGAAGEKFPGGLNAFLRQLALLEREMHADFAQALTPRELEDYEMQESNTGKTLQVRTADLNLTDDQKRLVYRVQRDFDDRFGLVFDVSPSALLERLKVQLIAREKIRASLGDVDYAKWLRAEDPAYFALRTMAENQGLPPTAQRELWQIKDDWTARKLEIAADTRYPPEQRKAMQAALVEQIRSRVLALVPADVVQASTDAFNWLPSAP